MMRINVRKKLALMSKYLFIHSLHAFQSADQVRCSRHSMAALQPALSWDFLHHVNESSVNCRSSPDIMHSLLLTLASHSRGIHMSN